MARAGLTVKLFQLAMAVVAKHTTVVQSVLVPANTLPATSRHLALVRQQSPKPFKKCHLILVKRRLRRYATIPFVSVRAILAGLGVSNDLLVTVARQRPHDLVNDPHLMMIAVE